MPATAMVTVTRHAEARAVLGDPRFVVPPVPAGAAQGVAWLRAKVARFSNGSVHERRRALAVMELDQMSPETLRRRAAGRVSALLAAGQPVDLVADVARAVPVDVLADALGVTTPVSAAVALVASGYHPGTDAGPAGDDAVTQLVELFGGTPDEVTAARIGLLVQAYEATAGLIENALRAMLRWQLRAPVEAVLAETLRHDPPVRVMRRVSTAPARVGGTDVATGTQVRIDLAAANRDPAVFSDPDRFDPTRPERERYLTLGAGLRPCPGRDHALAIAVGVVEAVRDHQRPSGQVGHPVGGPTA